MARDSEKYRYRASFEASPSHKDSSQVRCPTFNPLLENLLFSFHPRPILEKRITRGMRREMSGKEGQGRGEWNHPRDQYGNDARLPSSPPRYPRCYYAKRFAVLCHREYAGILEPSLNPIHRASIRLYRAISSPLFSFFFFEVSKRMAPLFDIIIIIIISRWRRKLVDLINPLPRFNCLWSSILILRIFVW